MTEVVLIVSIIVNFILVWYIARLLKKYFPISEDLEDLFARLEEYHFHIRTVSEMESFYGDEIIVNLLRHSRSITKEVDQFREAYSLLGEDYDLLEEENEEGGTDGNRTDSEEKDDASS